MPKEAQELHSGRGLLTAGRYVAGDDGLAGSIAAAMHLRTELLGKSNMRIGRPGQSISLLVLTLVVMVWTVSGQQDKRSSWRDRPRIRRATPSDAAAVSVRKRFLEMFARAYFPGRTGQLLIVPRKGDLITRPDPDVA